MKAGKADVVPFPWKRVVPLSLLAAAAAFGLWYQGNETKAPEPVPAVTAPAVTAKVSTRASSAASGAEPSSSEPSSVGAGLSPERNPSAVAPPQPAGESAPAAALPAEQEPKHSEASAPSPSAEMPEKSPFAAQSKPLDKGYYVPVGVFGRLDAAERLAGQLDALGFPARLQSRVLVGPYATRQEAQQAAERLKRQHKLGAAGVMQVK